MRLNIKKIGNDETEKVEVYSERMKEVVSERKSKRIQYVEETDPYEEASAKAKDLAFN